MATKANHPFYIYRGDTWRQTLVRYVDEAETIPMDLTDYVITGHARNAPDDSLWFELNITIPDPLNGVMMIHHTAEETEILSVGETTGKYDIQQVNQITGDKFTFIGGTITVTKDYTHN